MGDSTSATDLATLFAAHYSPEEMKEMLARRGAAGADAFFDQLYRDIDGAIAALEAQANYCQNDGEEKLSNFIAALLDRQGYNATAETHGRGHVDVTVRSRKLNIDWKAEAKIWKGVAYVSDGLSQLLHRYTTGREERGGVLIYQKKKNLVRKLQEWRGAIAQKRLCNFVSVGEVDRFWFTTHHTHDTGAPLVVRHWGVNLYFKPVV